MKHSLIETSERLSSVPLECQWEVTCTDHIPKKEIRNMGNQIATYRKI